MFNSNDILARLQNGENPEAIANDMANSLNHAIDQFHEEGLNDALDCAADDILTYLRTKYPKECAALDFELDGEDLGELLNVLMSILPMVPKVAPTCVSKDPIKAFLSEMGLLR